MSFGALSLGEAAGDAKRLNPLLVGWRRQHGRLGSSASGALVEGSAFGRSREKGPDVKRFTHWTSLHRHDG